jgi:uroporphyrinogen decarboxylase
MKINEEFCVNWANAQIAAGATAIVYFDPVSTTTIVPRDLYMTTGYKMAKNVISQVNGPVVTAMASGRCLPILNDIIDTGTVGVCVSAIEQLSDIKSICKDKITVLGNLNAIEMRNWTADEAERQVKKAIAAAGRGGGFILLDNHGEIPWQASDELLMAISDAVNKWGMYPLNWIE